MATAEKRRPADLADETDDTASDLDDYDAPVQNQQVARKGAPRNAASPGAVQAPQKEEKKSSAPSVRLDLNLEIEVTLKARIHGDLTLALL